MLAARLTQIPLTAFVTGLGRPALSIKPAFKPSNVTTRIQSYATRAGRIGRRKVEKSQSLKERLMAPGGEGGNIHCSSENANLDYNKCSVRVYIVIISKYATKIIGTQNRQVACNHGTQDQKQSTFSKFKLAQ